MTSHDIVRYSKRLYWKNKSEGRAIYVSPPRFCDMLPEEQKLSSYGRRQFMDIIQQKMSRIYAPMNARDKNNVRAARNLFVFLNKHMKTLFYGGFTNIYNTAYNLRSKYTNQLSTILQTKLENGDDNIDTFIRSKKAFQRTMNIYKQQYEEQVLFYYKSLWRGFCIDLKHNIIGYLIVNTVV